MDRSKKSVLADCLFYIGMALMPFDSIQGTMPSYYKPITVYALFLYIIVYFLQNGRQYFASEDRFLFILEGGKLKYNGRSHKFFLFAFYAVIAGAITNYLYVKQLSTYLSFVATLVFGLVIFYAVKLFLKDKASQYTNQSKILFFADLVSKVYLPVIIFGWIDLAMVVGLIPEAVLSPIKQFFGCIRMDRLSITTSEASWAAFHMIFALGANLTLAVKFKKFRYIFSTVSALVLVVASYSLAGIVSLGVGLLVFAVVALFYREPWQEKKKLVGVVIGLLVAAVAVAIAFYFVLEQYGGPYFNRISVILSYLSKGKFREILLIESSTFNRIGVPILNFIVFKDYPVFGVGGGNFEVIALDYIQNLFPEAFSFEEIAAYLEDGQIASAISLYARIFSEFGIVGVVLFYVPFFSIFRNCRWLPVSKNIPFYLWLFCSLAVALQFASFAFVHFWVILGVVDSLAKNKPPVRRQMTREEGMYAAK